MTDIPIRYGLPTKEELACMLNANEEDYGIDCFKEQEEEKKPKRKRAKGKAD